MREFPGGRASQAVLEALGSGHFAVLGADERLSLAARARLRVFARGETLFREGQESADPAFLLSGLVKLSRSAARGRECALHLVRPGRMLDAGVLFYEGGVPATAVGVREGRLLWLEKAALLDALRGNTALVHQQAGRFSGAYFRLTPGGGLVAAPGENGKIRNAGSSRQS